MNINSIFAFDFQINLDEKNTVVNIFDWFFI